MVSTQESQRPPAAAPPDASWLRGRVTLATSFGYPHVGGMYSHMSLLARRLAIPEPAVISPTHYFGAPKRFWPSATYAGKMRLAKVLGRATTVQMGQAMIALFRRVETDLVHCHDAMATWSAARARRRGGKRWRLVSTIHGPVSRHLREYGSAADSADVRAVEAAEREAWAEADQIIAVDTMQADIAREQGADPAKITIIPNAVDVREIDRQASALPLRKDDDRQWILVPRRLAPKNGVEFIVRAVALMHPRPRLILAGDGEEKDRLTQMIRELGIVDDVQFLGGIGHAVLLPIVAACDVVAVPSVPVHGVEEATSIAAIEGMALRRPVVASAIGGLRELIRDGESGLLVPPAQPEALAAALKRVASDPALARRVGEGARRQVEEKFSVDLWLGRHLDVYARALQPQGSSR